MKEEHRHHNWQEKSRFCSSKGESADKEKVKGNGRDQRDESFEKLGFIEFVTKLGKESRKIKNVLRKSERTAWGMAMIAVT